MERSVRWKLGPTLSWAQASLWHPADLLRMLHVVNKHEGALQVFTSPGLEGVFYRSLLPIFTAAQICEQSLYMRMSAKHCVRSVSVCIRPC